MDDDAILPVLRIEARSLDLPTGSHTNKMPFSGVLTRLDTPSDKPPNGSGGKRIIVTKAAAEAALDSLLGMAVDLTQNLDGHNAQNKIGIISSAKIEGDAIHIEGYLWAADFPDQALRIHLRQHELGFSFEARNLVVDDMKADPLVITRLEFTGAAILLRDDAAYRMTSLAAARAKEHEMEEELQAAVAKAVPDAIALALEPITKALADIAAAQAAQAESIEKIKQAPAIKLIEANAAMCAAVQPHVDNIRAAASAMENNSPPIGMGSNGHVHHLRRIASHMGAEAQRGHLPAEYNDSGSSFGASAERPTQTAEDDDVIIKDTPEFKELKASADKNAADLEASQKALKETQETMASMSTMLADIKAQMGQMRAPPERKTLTPQIAQMLARANLTVPEEGSDGTIQVGRIDAALAAMPNMSTAERMHFKTTLHKAGVIE